jgi:hypothetical protein
MKGREVVHLQASASRATYPPSTAFPTRQGKQTSNTTRFCLCSRRQGTTDDDESIRLTDVEKNNKKDRRSNMWRFVGGVFQPVMGAANYLLSPLKPELKPVVFPTGRQLTFSVLPSKTSFTFQD